MIVAKNLWKSYDFGETVVHALKGISLKISDGEFVSILGPSGSGKSTLLHCLSGLDKPSKGTVEIDGHDLGKYDDLELSILRRHKVGFVFQFFNLIPILSAVENVYLPLVVMGLSENELRSKAIGLLKSVGLGDRLWHTPNELSGGQRQRVAIARALINTPSVIFADEPTGNLDSKSGDQIFCLLQEINKEQNTTIVMVTHSEELANKTDRIIRIKDGVLI